ncbi:MAG: hypothetical protein ACFFFG_09670 [Candidatus Thorarchaeota archaeon]
MLQKKEGVKIDIPEEWGGVIPLEVFIDEAKNLVTKAEEFGVYFRLVGGLAIRLHVQPHGLETLYKSLKRLGDEAGAEITDIDGGISYKHMKKMDKFMQKLGYAKRKPTLSTAASQRRIYIHPKNWWFVDCFYGKMKFNHDIDLDHKRLALDSPTLPLAELLLGKTQIVQMNYKDIADTIMLLIPHKIGFDDEPETINIEHVGEKYLRKGAYAWGFYHTVTTNLTNIKNVLDEFKELSEDQRGDVAGKIDKISEYFRQLPKNRAWKARAKIGASKRWYRPVETTESVGEFRIFSGKHLIDRPTTLENSSQDS